jgi:hypothetical protein
MPHTGIRKRQRHNASLHHNKYEDCADYNISAGLIKSAINFYETATNSLFPWDAHPNLIRDDGVINTETGPAPYFNLA